MNVNNETFVTHNRYFLEKDREIKRNGQLTFLVHRIFTFPGAYWRKRVAKA